MKNQSSKEKTININFKVIESLTTIYKLFIESLWKDSLETFYFYFSLSLKRTIHQQFSHH